MVTKERSERDLTIFFKEGLFKIMQTFKVQKLGACECLKNTASGPLTLHFGRHSMGESTTTTGPEKVSHAI